MQYIDYQEYLDMGGICDATAFNRNIDRACGEIDARTKCRIRNMVKVPQMVKALCRDLVEYFSNNATTEKGITSWSESSGPVSESVSYANKTTEETVKEINDLFYSYLSGVNDDNGTPLLYRGCSI